MRKVWGAEGSWVLIVQREGELTWVTQGSLFPNRRQLQGSCVHTAPVEGPNPSCNPQVLQRQHRKPVTAPTDPAPTGVRVHGQSSPMEIYRAGFPHGDCILPGPP